MTFVASPVLIVFFLWCGVSWAVQYRLVSAFQWMDVTLDLSLDVVVVVCWRIGSILLLWCP